MTAPTPAQRQTEHEINFEFPYRLNGGDAAYFDCRALVMVDWGQKLIHYPPPAVPGYGPEIEEISNLEVDAGRAGWCTPDPALSRKIHDWLAAQHQFLIDKARE